MSLAVRMGLTNFYLRKHKALLGAVLTIPVFKIQKYIIHKIKVCHHNKNSTQNTKVYRCVHRGKQSAFVIIKNDK